MTTQSKTIRLPVDVIQAAERWAEAQGLTFTDAVEIALRDAHGMTQAPTFALLSALRDHVSATYDPAAFPQDVTLRVFHYMRSRPPLWALYQAATDHGADPSAVGSVHRRIGKGVKHALGAQVVGRSLPLDPAEHVIKSHALLAPGV